MNDDQTSALVTAINTLIVEVCTPRRNDLAVRMALHNVRRHRMLCLLQDEINRRPIDDDDRLVESLFHLAAPAAVGWRPINTRARMTPKELASVTRFASMVLRINDDKIRKVML